MSALSEDQSASRQTARSRGSALIRVDCFHDIVFSYLELFQILSRSLQRLVNFTRLSAIALRCSTLNAGFSAHNTDDGIGPVFG